MKVTENIRGAALMTGAMTAFVLNDTAMKTLAGELPLFQAILIRSVMVLVLMLVLFRVQNKPYVPIGRRDWTLIIGRGLVEVLAVFCFLTALFNMPIANATAILQALPLTVSLAAALFLKEHIGWRRILAILVGFLGVMLIIRPGTEGFSVYSIYALLAVFLVTARDLAARKLSRDVPTNQVALVTVLIIGAGSGLAAMSQTWVAPSLSMYGYMAIAAGFLVGGYIFSISAMRVGEIGFVTPFRYSSLLVAILVGWVFFDEWPDAMTLLGSAIVVATGAFTLLRERKSAP